MNRLVLAAVLALALPVLAAAQDNTRPAPDQRHDARQQAGTAAEETGMILRRGWDRTKVIAHKAGDALERGWHTVESGIRWGWNHPNGNQAPAQH